MRVTLHKKKLTEDDTKEAIGPGEGLRALGVSSHKRAKSRFANRIIGQKPPTGCIRRAPRGSCRGTGLEDATCRKRRKKNVRRAQYRAREPKIGEHRKATFILSEGETT